MEVRICLLVGGDGWTDGLGAGCGSLRRLLSEKRWFLDCAERPEVISGLLRAVFGAFSTVDKHRNS